MKSTLNDTKSFLVYLTGIACRGIDKLKVREVEVPSSLLEGKSEQEQLEEIFHFGQNDFQRKLVRSVSVGDIINFNNEFWIVANFGFVKFSDFTNEDLDIDEEVFSNIEMMRQFELVSI